MASTAVRRESLDRDPRPVVAVTDDAIGLRERRVDARTSRAAVTAAAEQIAALADAYAVVVLRPDNANGHLLDAELTRRLGPGRVVSLLAQVVVDPDHPAFGVSPQPARIVELSTIRSLLAAGLVVSCVGGGIPVAPDRSGRLVEVDGVVDADLTGALLARDLDAQRLLSFGDVQAVADRRFGSTVTAGAGEPAGRVEV